MLLKTLIEGIDVSIFPQSYRDFDVLTISCDSREEQFCGLFVALKGFKVNGKDFIKEAVDHGARIIAVDALDASLLELEDVCWLKVKDTQAFLHSIGQRFYQQPSTRIQSIGITGTNGKTTVAYLIEALIHAQAKRCGVIGTINHRIGSTVLPSKNTTPGFLDNQRYLARLVDLGVEYCVMETSSHALTQGRLEGIDFSAGIFTNLTQDHLDYHHDMEHYFQAKAMLFDRLGMRAHAVINADDAYGQRLLKQIRARVVSYAIDTSADLRAVNIRYEDSGTQFDVVLPQGQISIVTAFIGKHNVYNILAALAWAWAEGLPVSVMCEGIKRLTHVPGRLERVVNQQGIGVFIDYAHTPDGLENVLYALRAVSQAKIIVVFGCGGNRDRAKRPQMAEIVCRLADYAIVTTDNPRDEDPQKIIDEVIVGFTKPNYEIQVDRAGAIQRALHLAQKNQIVLIAGKGHEQYQILKDRTIVFNERALVEEFFKGKPCFQ